MPEPLRFARNDSDLTSLVKGSRKTEPSIVLLYQLTSPSSSLAATLSTCF